MSPSAATQLEKNCISKENNCKYPKLKSSELKIASINITGFKTEVAKDNAENRLAYNLAEEIRKEILVFQKGLIN